MCGRIDKTYTIRATADTINFKFRPLAANHHYFQTLIQSSKAKGSNNYNAGFKIFFQAIPPKSPLHESITEENELSQIIKTSTLIPNSLLDDDFNNNENENNEPSSANNQETKDKTGIKN